MRTVTMILPAVLLALTASQAPTLSHRDEPGLIDRVGWLTGCWSREKSGRIVEEHWMPPRGGTMLAMGRTTRNGVLAEYEFIFLSERDGRLAYEAHPSGQAPTTFRSAAPTDTMVVFSDPAHDFPQHVGYRRMGPDSLLAWIEASIEGRVRRVDFGYHRAPCLGS